MVRVALVLSLDCLRAPPVADRFCRTSCRRRCCLVRDAADSLRQLPYCCLALMSSLVSCILALPLCHICNLTLRTDLQIKKNTGAPAAQLRLPCSCKIFTLSSARALYINVSTLSPKIVLPVRRDRHSSKTGYGNSLRWRLKFNYRCRSQSAKLFFRPNVH